MAKTPAWQRKEGKNPSGGLNAKGRASYNRATGGNLKAPSKKVGNKRRASFCARMKGMKKKLTSKKTANDPNSRIRLDFLIKSYFLSISSNLKLALLLYPSDFAFLAHVSGICFKLFQY